jgi:hypothetical protein
VAQIGLQRTSILTVVRQLITASVAKHVGVSPQWNKLGGNFEPFIRRPKICRGDYASLSHN